MVDVLLKSLQPSLMIAIVATIVLTGVIKGMMAETCKRMAETTDNEATKQIMTGVANRYKNLKPAVIFIVVFVACIIFNVITKM